MTIDELADLVEFVRNQMRGRIDPRFRITLPVRNYENDNLMMAVEYVENEILSAELDVLAFVDGGMEP